ncbi:hypothetical protein [Xylanibacillus composti]|uniref:Multi-TM2 domain-containing protein n=1 Tax=Xylanibacillus composti TaxID=1572762 RepID=A0A8J4H117_9BACL|nr:hypothetical protein [Xylanibacillus composti]GIQ68968.1 hypothetical protein XYCOK13_17920 [Xylanibacillus composti]
MNKHPLLLLVLSLIPGLGHYFLGRRVRPFLYALGCFGTIVLLAILFILSGGQIIYYNDEIILFVLFCVLALWLINVIDMLISLLTRSTYAQQHAHASESDGQLAASPAQPDRSMTIFLSLVPGLGHMHIGLIQRGFTFMVGFFGWITMVLFVVYITNRGGFAVFLLLLPILWLFSLFDIFQQLKKAQNGEALVDRSILDDFAEQRDDGKKSKPLATLLAMFPGAGHMYLGLQRRGLQLMAAFLFSIYILDTLHLSLFLFVIPILWFFSLFDALQILSSPNMKEVKDVPFVDWLMNHQKWIGIALLLMGGYYLFDQIALDVLTRLFPDLRIAYWFNQYAQTFIVSTLLIVGGLKLLTGQKRSKKVSGR